MIQHIYNDDNIGDLYISPYCLFNISDDSLEISSWKQREIVRLHVLHPRKVIMILEKGVTAEELISILQTELSCSFEDAQNTLKMLVNKKIIE
jgi:hypothetical protein